MIKPQNWTGGAEHPQGLPEMAIADKLRTQRIILQIKLSAGSLLRRKGREEGTELEQLIPLSNELEISPPAPGGSRKQAAKSVALMDVRPH